MTEHTPGPWRLVKDNSRPMGLSVRLKEAAGPKILGVIHTGDDEYLANASLIASAPDLLAALKVASELLDRNDIRRPEIDAAIAKAEGRS